MGRNRQHFFGPEGEKKETLEEEIDMCSPSMNIIKSLNHKYTVNQKYLINA